jgi:hypothetical protein
MVSSCSSLNMTVRQDFRCHDIRQVLPLYGTIKVHTYNGSSLKCQISNSVLYGVYTLLHPTTQIDNFFDRDCLVGAQATQSIFETQSSTGGYDEESNRE